MRNRRIIAIVTALATVGIVGALAVRGADDAGVVRTLKDVTEGAGSGASDSGANDGVAGPLATGTAGDAGAAAATRPGSGEAGDASTGQAARTASTYLPIDGLTVPQTYRASVEIVSWREREARLAEVMVREAGLLGAVDPATGQPTGPPADPKLDRSGYVEGRRLLVTVTEQAAADLPASGVAVVHLVFVPSGAGAVFWIDRVVE